MPLVHVTIAEGTTSQDRRAQIGDGIYRALIDVTNVPEDDRFQVINEVPSANLIYVWDRPRRRAHQSSDRLSVRRIGLRRCQMTSSPWPPR